MNISLRTIQPRHPASPGLGLALVLTAGPAAAVPVTAGYIDDPTTCDSHAPITLGHELGDVATFPLDEALAITVTQAAIPSHFSCAGDDGIPNEWIVRMTNLSAFDYTDLFFVADVGASIGNVDGFISDLLLPGSSPGQAFRIDGTVTVGTNNPLLFESGPIDEVLQSGETWEFTVTNFLPFTAPVFESPGGFAASSSPDLLVSNASIVANVVPEPASLALIGAGGVMCGLRRRPEPA